jgi:hypothetical protein
MIALKVGFLAIRTAVQPAEIDNTARNSLQRQLAEVGQSDAA